MSSISIITSTFNSETYILDTYDSVRSQTFADWEWIITDDNSQDQTYNIIREMSERDSRIRIFRLTNNKGAGYARNNSISHANGKYIAFLDSDDLWLPKKLETQYSEMEDKKLPFSFTAYSLIDEAGNLLQKSVDLSIISPVSYEDMLRKKATIGCSTVMLNTNAFGSSIKMPIIRTGQDYALWLKLLRGGSLATPIPDILTYYRIRSNSISRNKLKKARRQWTIYRKIENMSFSKSITCFTFYAWRAIFR